jgi:predicted alpha-1,6-mannanase (GH76 family)
MARPLKYKNMVIHITEWLKDELKHDASVVNGIDKITDGTEDIVQGRYEVCRELLHFIRAIGGEQHDELDTD